MAAGNQLVDGRIPGQRIATTTQTSDGSGFTTTRTDQMSVDAEVVNGRTYQICCMTHFASTASGNTVLARIWEDSSSGTEVQSGNCYMDGTSSLGFPLYIEVDWTATATGSKTFVLDAVVSNGAGTAHLEAAGIRPSSLYVKYVEG